MDNQKPETGRRFFDWMRTTGFVRPDEGWLGGIFAGISLKVGWDAALVRGLGVVALIIFFAPAALLYGLAWMFIPDREGRIHAQQAVRGDYTSGFIGGAVLTVIGALNIFTPVSVAGPLAVLLNLVILGAVGWLVYVMVRNHRRSAGAQDSAGSASAGAAGGATPGRFDGSGRGSAGKAEAGSSQPPRADGKPAWYPREDSTTSAASQNSAAGPAARERTVSARTQAPRAEQSPREQAARRRRRQLSWGLGMLALPVIVGIAWLGTMFGLSTLTVAVTATAGLVLFLGLTHFTAALRGRPGTPGLLALSTAAMLVLFAGQGAAGFGGGTNHAFGNYETSESQVQSVFSNTTVDLRELADAGGTSAEPAVREANVNQAFSNTTVIVPDETRVVISNGQALSNLEIDTQDESLQRSGISGDDLVIGPEDAQEHIRLELNSAFGNTTIYDSTTYEQEAGQQP